MQAEDWAQVKHEDSMEQESSQSDWSLAYEGSWEFSGGMLRAGKVESWGERM